MIERHFSVPFVAVMSLREKQIQQNYRPVIAVHKWFARRPGTLFRALILSEFSGRPVIENFYQAHNMPCVYLDLKKEKCWFMSVSFRKRGDASSGT